MLTEPTLWIIIPPLYIGLSPSGKAMDSDSIIRRFESYQPRHIESRFLAILGSIFLPFLASSNPASNLTLNAHWEGVDNMHEATVISQWGNSKGIRIPVEVLRKVQLDLNDKLFFEVDESERIILMKAPTPKQGTLEYLFKDYDGDSFQTELVDLGESVGNEKW